MKKSKFIPVLLIVSIAIAFFSFKEDLFLVSKNMDIFASLYKEISINYVEDTDPSDLMRTGIDSMLEGLDPYTEYIPESEIEEYKLKYVSTQYGGIGAGTVSIEKKLYVNEVLEGNPAHKQDIRPGDLIVSINDIPTFGKDRIQISQLLRGPKGSPVKLQLERAGVILEKSVVRDEIKQPNVSYSGMLDNQLGYIKLDKFLENSAQEVKDALIAINRQQPKGLILDLRNNGGGILQEAVKIVNLFVEENLLVVVQKGRNPAKTVSYKSVAKPMALNLPLVVLINSSSASASEIVAGALQDLDRAVIIGQRSYGKGLVQQTFNLPYNSLVKITVAKYYTPSGRCIQALDYAHKDQNGMAGKFADSVMKAFSTKAGRTVYNGNGIYPDLIVAPSLHSSITQTLVANNLFFNYANQYRTTHKAIGDAKSFQLSDADYQAFLTSIKGKDYTYTANTEKLLTLLTAEAEKENRLTNMKADLDLLKEKLLATKKNELENHKQEVKQVLETQIVGRYYFDKGKVEQSFQYDQEVKRAKALFAANFQILSILKGEGGYKTIGSPKKIANQSE
ncbi:S41 family peptidase [Pedobacter sp. Du54]|uniref:S41 family peptidase n=1 Tax=Pedobacter anseongensis TaxID=3133439 RepID=UPI003095467E